MPVIGDQRIFAAMLLRRHCIACSACCRMRDRAELTHTVGDARPKVPLPPSTNALHPREYSETPGPLASGAFFGHSITRRRVAGLVVVESVHGALLRVPHHRHENAYLALIREGTFTETLGRRTRVAVPGMLLVNPPGERHSERMDDHPVSSLNIELSSAWLRELFDLGIPLDRSSDFRSDEIAHYGRRMLREVARDDPDSALTIESLTWQILHAALSRPRLEPGHGEPRWLRDVRDLIDGSLANPPTLRELAQAAGVHPVHFAVVFRRHYGCSLGEYSRRRRLVAARQHVADPARSLAEIAAELGFSDQSHLTRVFKRYTGMAPHEYRTFLAFKTT